MWLWDAIVRVEKITGSRERAEQELCEHLRTGRLPAEVWRQAGGRGHHIPVPKEYWTLETLRKVASADGVDQGGGRNWYQVNLLRFEELYPARSKPRTAKGKKDKPKRQEVLDLLLAELCPAAHVGADILRIFKKVLAVQSEIEALWNAKCTELGVSYKVPQWDMVDAAIKQFKR